MGHSFAEFDPFRDVAVQGPLRKWSALSCLSGGKEHTLSAGAPPPFFFPPPPKFGKGGAPGGGGGGPPPKLGMGGGGGGGGGGPGMDVAVFSQWSCVQMSLGLRWWWRRAMGAEWESDGT